jgi:hypothetical protein
LERENLIFDEKMLKKYSTDQRFIQKRNTTYKIGTLIRYIPVLILGVPFSVLPGLVLLLPFLGEPREYK